MPYYIYILRCADDSLYTGSTNDLDKRLKAHNESKTGARYTKSRRPVKLIYAEEYPTKQQALSRESEIKQMTRAQKLKLLKT